MADGVLKKGVDSGALTIEVWAQLSESTIPKSGVSKRMGT